MRLAPDGDFALVASEGRDRLALVPVNGGAPRWLAKTGLKYQWARFFPDGRRLLIPASRPQQGIGLYVQSLGGAEAKAISPEIMLRKVEA